MSAAASRSRGLERQFSLGVWRDHTLIDICDTDCSEVTIEIVICSLHNEKPSYSIDHDDNVNMYGAVKWL